MKEMKNRISLIPPQHILSFQVQLICNKACISNNRNLMSLATSPALPFLFQDAADLGVVPDVSSYPPPPFLRLELLPVYAAEVRKRDSAYVVVTCMFFFFFPFIVLHGVFPECLKVLPPFIDICGLGGRYSCLSKNMSMRCGIDLTLYNIHHPISCMSIIIQLFWHF